MKRLLSVATRWCALATMYSHLLFGVAAEGVGQPREIGVVDIAQPKIDSSSGSPSAEINSMPADTPVDVVSSSVPAVALPGALEPATADSVPTKETKSSKRRREKELAYKNELLGFIEMDEERERASRELQDIKSSYSRKSADLRLDTARRRVDLRNARVDEAGRVSRGSKAKQSIIFRERGLYKKNIITADFGMQYVYAELGAYNDINYSLHAGGVIAGMGLNPETTFFSLSGSVSYTRLIRRDLFLNLGVSTRGANDDLLTDPNGIKSNFSSTGVSLMVGKALLDTGKFAIRGAIGLTGSAVYINPVSDRNIVRGANAAEKGETYAGDNLEWYTNKEGNLYPYDPNVGAPSGAQDTTGGKPGHPGTNTISGNAVQVGGAVVQNTVSSRTPDPYLNQIGGTYTLGIGVGVGLDFELRPTARQSVVAGLKFSVGPDYLYYAKQGGLGYSLYGAFELSHNISITDDIDVYYKAGVGVQYIDDTSGKFFLTYFLDAFVNLNVGISYKF